MNLCPVLHNHRRDTFKIEKTAQEYLWQTKKSDYMVRSNPIGLAEPSQRRDGYAVGGLGGGGGLYRSTEQISGGGNSGKIQTRPRASSATPEGAGEGGIGGWKRQAGKSSPLNSSTGMIR